MSKGASANRSRDGSASPALRGSIVNKLATKSNLKLDTDASKRKEVEHKNATDNIASMPPTPPRSPAPKPSSQLSLQPSVLQPAVAQDMQAVDSLLATMKKMLVTLGTSFDTLGKQTVAVASLPIAIDAMHQIAVVRQELEERQKKQDLVTDGLHKILMQEVKSRIQHDIKERSKEIVQEIIAREVVYRVKAQLEERITAEMRQEMLAYKQQIGDIQVRLHNAEARRHNALIRTTSEDEPLRPLLRSPRATTSAPTHAMMSGSTQPPTLAVNIDGSGGETQPLSALIPESPTPSPDWPRDLTTLVKLRPEQARALAKDYDLDDGSIGQASKTVSEEFVNRFLNLAGVVNLKVVTTSLGHGRSASSSPLFARISD